MSIKKIKDSISSASIMKLGIVQPVLITLLIVASFFLGSLWTEVKYLKKTSGQQAIGIAPAQQAPEGNGAPVKVSVDDDPVLGDKKAKVTLIEFSDTNVHSVKDILPTLTPKLKKTTLILER